MELENPLQSWDAIKARTDEEHDRQLRIKSKTNPTHKFVVIGFIKCGQNSLQKFLKKKYPYAWVEHVEITWKIEGPQIFKKRYPGFTPFIITRNPVDRMWSSYWYLGLYSKMSYPEFVEGGMGKKVNSGGCGNPIIASDYELFIEPYKEFDPVVLRLEEMRKNLAFPLENKGERKEKPSGPMPQAYRDLTMKLLKESEITY